MITKLVSAPRASLVSFALIGVSILFCSMSAEAGAYQVFVSNEKGGTITVIDGL